MSRQKNSVSSCLLWALSLTLLLALLSTGSASAQTITPLYSFAGSTDTFGVKGPLVFDSAGNAYGSSTDGGAYGYGGVFQLTPPATSGGAWTETVIYSFDAGVYNTAGADSLAIDHQGNLYGTTQSGKNQNCINSVCGTAYKLLHPPKSGGAWTYRLLHAFKGGKTDGNNPIWGVVIVGNNIYGTTLNGGPNGEGVLFQLSPSGTTYTETLIHSFPDSSSDGYFPVGLTADNAGNLYGVTLGGGPNDGGIVYKFSPSSGGGWTETTVFSPDPTTYGDELAIPPVLDGSGAIWGVTQYGGSGEAGTLFRLHPASGGLWTPELIHSFYQATDGYQLFFDRSTHTLYGVIAAFNVVGSGGCGYIYQATQSSGGIWQFAPAFNFSPASLGMGCMPYYPMSMNASGTLFGLSQTGGTNGDGLAFQFAP
jgi:uncharacterized repeat protein (TIGR03803 family)